MRTVPKIREPRVQYGDPEGPGGVDITPEEFASACRTSALARFRTPRTLHPACPAVGYTVPPKFGDPGPTGAIVAHLDPRLVAAWEAAVAGLAHERRRHVEQQVALALEDLGLQDMHGLLALTPGQRDFFALDLAQLVAEALDRTTFSRLGRAPLAQWEGTLVQRLSPPFVVLQLSIRFAPARRAVTGDRGTKARTRAARRSGTAAKAPKPPGTPAARPERGARSP